MATAPGIAIIISNLGSSTYRFIAKGTSSFSVNDDVSGTWTRSTNTITWNGTDPQMQNTTGSTVSVTDLQVWTSSIGDVMANIPHTGVSLADNDTIVYTSIQISFTTDDLT